MPERKGTTGVVGYIALLMIFAASFGNGTFPASGGFSASAVEWRDGVGAVAISKSPAATDRFRFQVSGRTYEARVVDEAGFRY
jgi:hypothetical protein